MFLNQDYRSRAIGVVAAMGVLITVVIVDRTTVRKPDPVQLAACVGSNCCAAATRLKRPMNKEMPRYPSCAAGA